MTPSSKEIREYFAKFGRKGGHARASKLSDERRSEIASDAAKAMWKKKKQKEPKKA